MAPPVNRIRRLAPTDAPSSTPTTYYPVLIIGAGESGIAMGCRLRSVLGFDQFRIFDRKSGLGGTWYANQYPGIACDVPAILYSFSWYQNPKWTQVFPSGKEIVRYLYDVCEKFEILDKIQLDSSVKSVVWKEEEEEWEVVIEYLAPGVGDMGTPERTDYEKSSGVGSAVLRTETVRTKVVISAVGGLVEPKPLLDVPGIDTFQGEIMHTARWDPTIDLKDKEVIVVGTGCSAGQVVPELVKPEHGAKHVTQLLRSPPWAVPPPLPPAAVEKWSVWMPWLSTYIPGFQNTFRKVMFTTVEMEWLSLFSPSEAARKRRDKTGEALMAYMRKVVPEQYHEILTPDYEVFCKRRVVDNGWFQSLQDDRIEITSLPLTKVDGKTVTLGPGRHYPPESKTDSKVSTDAREVNADVLIMANGYETNQWLHPLDITGRDGRSLYKTWQERGGAQAYLGTAMDGFPNFFIIFGPNTATGHSSVILASENMVNYTLNFVKGIMQGDVRTWEVKESAERQWTDMVQKELRNSVFSSGCVNWYTEKNGWNSTTYPRTQIDHTIRCMFPVWWHWDGKYTTKGLAKLTLSRIFKLWAAASVVYAVVFAARNGPTRSREALVGLVIRARTLLRSGVQRLAAAM